MKATSVLNLLTAVTLLLTVSFSWGANVSDTIRNAQYSDATTKEECESACKVTEQQERDCAKEANETAAKNPAGATATQMINACKNSILSECKANCSGYDSKKDIKKECEDAVKEWKENGLKSKNACDEYDAVGRDNSCDARIAECEKKISAVANLMTPQAGVGGQFSGNSIDVLSQFYAQKNGVDLKTLTGKATQTQTTSCLKWSNDKVDDKKKEIDNKIERIDDKIKSAKEKITDLEKEIAKENESLRKETATLDEEKEKIQTTFNENNTKINSEKSDKYIALNKSIQENLIKIRNMNNAIIKKKEELEKEKFDQTQRLVDFADDKIESQCKNAVDTARSCFMRAAKGEKFPPKDACEGFSPTGKGVTGTSVMVKKLNDVRTACFERATMASDRLKYDYQSKIRTIEQDIMEKQTQIKDLNSKADLEKKEFDEITKTADAKLANEKTSTEQKQTNLTEKLAKLKTSTEEKIAASTKRIDQIKLEIEELVAKKLPQSLGIIPDSNGNDIKVAHREAKAAIQATESSRSSAYDKCDCKKNDKTATCIKLKTSTSDNDGGGIGGKAKRSGR